MTREGHPSICRELLPEKATLQEQQKLCSVSFTCKVAATMGHLGWEPGTPGRRAAGNWTEASCSQDTERPGTQASREAPGLCGRRPGRGMRSLRTRSWARRRLTIITLEAQAQTLAKVGTSRKTCPCRGVTRKSPASFTTPSAHSNVSKSFGKTLFTATLKSWPRFP